MESFKSVDLIKRDVKTNLSNQGIYDPSEGSLLDVLITSILDESVTDITRIGTVLQQDMFATSATGAALDAHASSLGLLREKGSHAYDMTNNNFMVYITNNKKAREITTDQAGIYIPENTMVYTNDNKQLRTVQPIYIPPDGNSGYSPVVSTDIVTDTISAGTIVKLGINMYNLSNITVASANGERLNCTNKFQISGGTYAETDAELKYRMFQKTRSYHDMMLYNIRTIALSIPDIQDIKIYKNTHGVGTIGILPITIDPLISEGIAYSLQTALEKINDGSIKIIVPEYLVVKVHTKLYYNTKNRPSVADIDYIKTMVSSKIKDYINNLRMGETLSLSAIETVAKSASPKLQAAQITCLLLDDRACSLSNQKAGWDEKFITAEDPSNPSVIFVEETQ